jgi:hypothetical protein
MPTGPRKARPDDGLRIELGIAIFADQNKKAGVKPAFSEL